uniref:Zgc:165604 n=1 Tax=Latimeria chalumnae TaxID=7897 RepID=H3AG42_LATCH
MGTNNRPNLWGVCAFKWEYILDPIKVSVGTSSIQVVRGDSALLPCSFITTAALNRLNIIWTVTPLSDQSYPQQVIAYEQSQIVESLSQYTGRVGFAISPTKSATIFINNTQTSDTGTYQCMVNNPPDTSQPNIGVIGLTVLVPPSTPICSSQGRADEGGSITLSCKVEEGIPAPIFTWERMEPQRQTLVTLLEAEDNRGMAVLHNLSTETSGLYRCTAYNLLSSASCSVQLHVQIAPSSPSGIVVGVVVTLVMGLVLLALFVLVLWLHHNGVKKWSEDEGSYNDIRYAP